MIEKLPDEKNNSFDNIKTMNIIEDNIWTN